LDPEGARITRLVSVVAKAEGVGFFRPGFVSSEAAQHAAIDIITNSMLAANAVGVQLRGSSMGIPLEEVYAESVEGSLFSSQLSMVSNVSCRDIAGMKLGEAAAALQRRCGPQSLRALDFMLHVTEKRRAKLGMGPASTNPLKEELLKLPEVRGWNAGNLLLDVAYVKRSNRAAIELLRKAAETQTSGVTFIGTGTKKKEQVRIGGMLLFNLLKVC
jgi:hypothetical protein